VDDAIAVLHPFLGIELESTEADGWKYFNISGPRQGRAFRAKVVVITPCG
jgi:hypothetical protein